MENGGLIRVVLIQLCIFRLIQVRGTSCNWTYTGKDNLQCYPCLPGFKKSGDCLFNYTQADCVQCQEGTYMSDCNTAYTCSPCTSPFVCDLERKDILSNCTATTNFECKCKQVTYLLMPEVGYCSPHSSCVKGAGVKASGNAVNDTLCEDCVSGETYSSNSSAYDKCKPCTVCKRYLEYCTPSKDAHCDTDILTGTSVAPLFIPLTIMMTMTVFILALSLSLRHKIKKIYQSRERNNNTHNSIDRISRHSSLISISSTGGLANVFESDISIQFSSSVETNTEDSASIKDIPTPALTGERHFQCTACKPVNVVNPLISSNNGNTSVETSTYGQGANAIPDHRINTISNQTNELRQRREYERCDVRRQLEQVLLSPDKTKASSECSEKGSSNADIDANTDIHWFKIFNDLAAKLPVEESWKFFAFELLDLCKQKSGLPKDIDNEVKQIAINTSKNIRLAYLEVFKVWHRIMADDASLDHIEQVLQGLGNYIILKEVRQIKSNPPRIKRPTQITDLSYSLIPYMKQTQQYIPRKPCFVAYAQHEHTYETQETRAQSRERQMLQFTDIGGETVAQVSQAILQEPSMRLPLTKGGRIKEQFADNKSYHGMLNYGHSKVTKKVSRNKMKLRNKFEATRKLKILEKQHIKTIKKLLPLNTIPLTRQEYNVFLDYTVNTIMEHNNVARKVVLSITYKAYEEIAKTKDSERYSLYCGSPKLNLDRKQYECLEFYVKYARARVLRELGELGEKGDGIFLFLTFDGKSALEGYQRKKRSLKKTDCSDWCGMDSRLSSVSTTNDASSQSDDSEISEINDEDDPIYPCRSIASGSNSVDNSDQFAYSSKINSPLQEELSDTSDFVLHTEKYVSQSYENSAGNEIEGAKHEDEDHIKSEVSQQISAEELPYNEPLGARNDTSSEPLSGNISDKMLNETSIQYTDMSLDLDDIVKHIDKELNWSTYE